MKKEETERRGRGEKGKGNILIDFKNSFEDFLFVCLEKQAQFILILRTPYQLLLIWSRRLSFPYLDIMLV